MKIEFILCHEDGTWLTEILDVPDNVTEGILQTDGKWDEAVMNWIDNNQRELPRYRKIIFWGLYNSNPFGE